MLRRRLSKKLGVALAVALSMNITTTINVQATEGIRNLISTPERADRFRVMPMPKEMNVLDGFVNLNDSVNVIGLDSADIYAVNLLKNILRDLGVTVNETFVGGATTIYIGEDNDNIEEMNNALVEMGVSMEDTANPEGYILATEDNENGDKIVIKGNGETGTFYGVQTLKQIINEDKTLSEVVVKDEPSIKLRAVVEGFYGTPWTQEERLDQIKMYGEYKMNAYIYAPKSDPYHREKWREPYPESELDRMNELIQTANENKVDFVFAISPGLDIKFQGEEAEADFNALINKAQTLYEMGVRSFAILWDDIGNDEGDKQAEVLNRFNSEFVKAKGDVKPLITVPKEYWASYMYEQDGQTIKKYTEDFASTLDKDIEVMWTGHDVIPPNGVSMDDANRVTDIYGKKMLLWWNYPVNDYKEDKLALGPIYSLDKNLDDEISGFIVNPMRFAEASKISTITGADYGWNTKEYDYNRSWNNSLGIIGKDAKEELKSFANHSTRLDTGRPDSPELNTLIETMWGKWEKGEDVSFELDILTKEFNNMKTIPEKLRANLKNEKLLNQIENHLVKFGMYADTGLTIVDMLKNIKEDNMIGFWSNKYSGTKSLLELDSKKELIGNLVIDPFIRKAHEIGNEYFDNKTTSLKDKVYNYEYFGNVEHNEYEQWYMPKETHNPSKMFDELLDNGFWSKDVIKEGDYVGFDLGKVQKIKNVYLLMGKTGYDNEILLDGVLEYSNDGVNWREIASNSSNREILFEGNIEARYIRYRATKDSENKLFVRDFKINVNKTLEKSLGKIDSSKAKISKGTEGDEEFIELSNIGEVTLKAGDTIGISLNDIKNVVALTTTGEFKNEDFIIESSLDNRSFSWEEVSSGSSFRKTKPVIGKYFRIRALKDTKVNLESIKIHTEGRPEITMTTNRPINPERPHRQAIYGDDYDTGTQLVTTPFIQEGDYIQIDLGKVINVRDIRLLQGHDEDFTNNGILEYSVDGENWTKIDVAFGSNDIVVKDLDIEARYLKATSTKYRDRWIKVREFTVNNLTEEYLVKATAKGTYVDRAENTRDNNLNTAYIPSRDIVAGDDLLYRILDNKLSSKITIVQGIENISGAKVTAENSKGQWIELGSLTEGYNEFNLEESTNIVAVKLIWNDNIGKPEIFEIKPTFVAEASEGNGENPGDNNGSGDNGNPDGSGSPGNGGNGDNLGNGGNTENGENTDGQGSGSGNASGETDGKGNLPTTGTAVGVTALGVIGSALAAVGVILRRKKK
ncbi:MAG: beta-N-acetylglucosaminidase domain-containing protein [Clostridium septicum]|uniref:beta-N-acetylglucosaminidase domain-containing protein n=1 Tax=Clostridium septicum TaxID=1504 RepID=UPI00258E3565|nr:beta-N-acetylglucosaminidase domain-containing protein [Clostridium septicum]MDU1314080.1 beta-N-acetylglucosaminidase domain-containing protein [Clostridium septicum]